MAETGNKKTIIELISTNKLDRSKEVDTPKVSAVDAIELNEDVTNSYAHRIKSEMTDLKKSVADGKSGIASAISNKGVSTAADASFDTMKNNINSITTLSQGSNDATAVSGDILSGKTAYVKGSKIVGTMPNKGAVSSTLNAGGSYTIPEGYHNGSGKVTANSLASQTPATAVSGDILSGKTAYVKGSKVIGTMKALSDYRYIPDATIQMRERTSYTDANGDTQSCSNTKFFTMYEGAEGKVNANYENMILASRLGNASSSDVRKNKTFTSEKGIKITGSLETFSSQVDRYNPDATIGLVNRSNFINKDFNNESCSSTKFFRVQDGIPGIVNANSANLVLASKLGNATAADVRSGKTFTSEAGIKVTGTATLQTYPDIFYGTISQLSETSSRTVLP